MNPPAQGGASTPAEGKEKKGFGKVLSRFKTVLRKGESSSSKRQSQILSGPKTTTAAPSKTETTTPKKTYVSNMFKQPKHALCGHFIRMITTNDA
jgi:HSP90 family molecular chaperone